MCVIAYMSPHRTLLHPPCMVRSWEKKPLVQWWEKRTCNWNSTKLWNEDAGNTGSYPQYVFDVKLSIDYLYLFNNSILAPLCFFFLPLSLLPPPPSPTPQLPSLHLLQPGWNEHHFCRLHGDTERRPDWSYPPWGIGKGHYDPTTVHRSQIEQGELRRGLSNMEEANHDWKNHHSNGSKLVKRSRQILCAYGRQPHQDTGHSDEIQVSTYICLFIRFLIDSDCSLQVWNPSGHHGRDRVWKDKIDTLHVQPCQSGHKQK